MVAPHTDSQPQYHHQSTSGCQRKLFAATPARGAEERSGQALRGFLRRVPQQQHREGFPTED